MNTTHRTTSAAQLQPASRPFVIAVTGHCELGSPATLGFVQNAFDQLLAQLQADHQENLVVLSGLAAGADTLFAEAALALGITLDVCLSASDIIENFTPGPEREQFLHLCKQSRSVIGLPFATRSNGAYMALGYWLVDTCDLLIAAWNGHSAAALGGTGDVVAYARAQGRPVIHIHTLEHMIA